MSVFSWSNFTGGEISPLLSGRTDIPIYSSSAARMENFIPLTHGPVMRRSGFRYIAQCEELNSSEVSNSDAKIRLIPYRYSADNSYILEFGHKYIRILSKNGYLMNNGYVITVTTPYISEELATISYAQSGAYLYVTHKNHDPRMMYNFNALWLFTFLNYFSQSPQPTISQIKLTRPNDTSKQLPLVKKASYCITGVDSKGRQSLPSPVSVEIDAPAACDYENYITITWQSTLEGAEYFVYEVINGIPAYVGRTAKTSFLDKGLLAPNLSRSVPKRVQYFNIEKNYPSKVAFFDQRMIFAGSVNEPNTIWGSVPGDFSLFVSESSPTDSCAWKFTIASGQANHIMWLQSASKLLIGTAGDEWRMGGNNGGTITPHSVEVRKETAWGSADMKAISVGQEVLFVDRTRKNIRTFQYTNTSDSYISSNLNIFAEHLTRKRRIIDWDYAAVPHSIIWTITDDGLLLGLTYDQAHQVIAWHKHTTDGKFESVAVIPEGEHDALYAVIRRNINGKDMKYIERLEPDFNSNDTKDAFFLDSALTYNGAPATVISGMNHLAGKTVHILADGATHPERVVSPDGKVTLQLPAKIVHIGLPYDSALETMPIEIQTGDGTTLSRTKRITEVSVYLEDSLGMLIGPDEKRLTTVPFRDTSMPPNSPPKLFSGEKKIANDSGYELEGSILIKQVQPLPMLIKAILPRIQDVGR